MADANVNAEVSFAASEDANTNDNITSMRGICGCEYQ